MTIRKRLTLQFGLLVLGILGIASVTIYLFSEDHREQDFYQRMKSKAESTAKLLIAVDAITPNLLAQIEDDNPVSLPEEGIIICKPDGFILYHSDKHNRIPFNKELLRTIVSGQEVRFDHHGYDILGFRFSDHSGQFIVLITARDIFGKIRIRDLKWVMFTVFSVSLIFIFGVGWVYAGRALRPISLIIARVKQISISSLNLRLDEGNRVDEISKLSQTFNNMLERIESGLRIQKDFIANASHEMRTPLTSMTGQLEVALMSPRTASRYQEVLASVLDDIKNLNRTSNRLLLLAQADTENLKIEMEAIRVDDLIWQCQEELKKLEPDYEIEVDLDFRTENEEDLLVLGNAQLLKTCVTNLMENGCKYSPSRRMRLVLTCSRQGNILEFIDQGIGIPKADLGHIFEPFYRASNSTSSRGHGIGLSLVHKIVRIHKGTIFVESELGKGTRFTLTLPPVPLY